MPVTLYTTPGCPQCRITARHLDLHAIEHDTLDLATDPEALAYVRDHLGYTAAPVIVVTTEGCDEPVAHWSGYRPDRLNELAGLATVDPAPLSPETITTHTGPGLDQRYRSAMG